MYYCHTCDDQITPASDEMVCPNCSGGFIEELTESVENFNDGPPPPATNDFQFLQQMLFPTSSVQGNLRTGLGEGESSSATSQIPNLFSSFFQPQSNGANRNTGGQVNMMNMTVGLPNSQGQGSTGAGSTGQVLNNQGQIQQELQRAFQGFENSIFRFPMGVHMPNWNFMELHGNSEDYAWGPNGLDNIISQLLGQLENSGPPPASKQAINSLPIHLIQQTDVEKELECSVCMEIFKLNDKTKKLPCNHIFHIACIEPWLKLHNTCPICRKLVEESCSSHEHSNNSLFNFSFPPNRNSDDDHTYST